MASADATDHGMPGRFCLFCLVPFHRVRLTDRITYRPSARSFLAAGLMPGLPACRLTAGPLGGAEIAAVVLAEGVLLAFADLRVRVDVRGVFDLVLGHGQHDQLAVEPGPVDRREALPGAEQAGLHKDPPRLPGLVVEVHLADLADPVALGVDSGAVAVIRTVLRGGHSCLPLAGGRACRYPGHAARYKACSATL